MQIDSLKMQIAMARCKMDNAELAKVTGLSKNTVVRMQHNNPECKPVNVGIIASSLNCDVTDIILM